MNVSEPISPLSARHSNTARQLAASAFAFITVIGVIGNALSLVALKKLSRRRSAHTIFLFGLCTADLIFCLTSVPWEISRYSHGRWKHNTGALCSFLGFAKFYNFGVSLLFLSLIAINRFVLIVFTDVYHRLYQTRYVLVQVVGICVYALLMLLPTLAGSWGRFGFLEGSQNCAIVAVDGASPIKTLFILAFLAPCAVICVCYTGIALAVIRSSRRVQRHDAVQPEFPRSSSSSRRTWGLTSSDYRVVRVGLTVFLAFVALCLPNTVSLLTEPDPTFDLVGFILMYATACVNPLIYVAMDYQYRHACRSIFCRGVSSPESSKHADRRDSETDCNNEALTMDSTCVETQDQLK